MDDLKEINNNKIKKDYNKIIDDFLNLNNKLIILNLIEVIYLNQDGIINIYYKIQKPHN